MGLILQVNGTAGVGDGYTLTGDTISSATQGKFGLWLDNFIDNSEALIFGGKDAAGQAIGGCWNEALSLAGSLAAIFCLIFAARIAFRTMAQGEKLDVLALLRPIFISLILANWWTVTYTLFSFFKPLENGFKYMYEYQNERVDSLRNVRRELQFIMSGEVENIYLNALLIEEIENMKKEKEEREKDYVTQLPEEEGTAGSGVVWGGENNTVKDYTEVMVGDIMHEEPEVDPETGMEVMPDDMGDITTEAIIFEWVERVILWLAEVYWSVMMYLIFLVKYLFLYVLVLFGPVYIVCSLLPVWKDKWSDWLGHYLVTNMYGACAFLVLTFGLLIIEWATVADIYRFKATLVDIEGTFSYLKYIVNNGFGSMVTYLLAVLVAAIALPQSFEMASHAFPGGSSRAAGRFLAGMVGYIKFKSAQVVRNTVILAVGAATGQLAAAEKTRQILDEEQRKEKDKEDEEVDKTIDVEEQGDVEAEQADGRGPGSIGGGIGGTRTGGPDEDGVDDPFAEEWNRQHEEYENSSHDETMDRADDTINMYGKAYAFADRMAYMAAEEPGSVRDKRDIAGDISDRMYLGELERDDAEKADVFKNIKDNRLKEDLFLMGIAATAGQYQRRPNLLGWAAVFGRDTKTSPADARRFLKQNGLYTSYRRLQILQRILDTTYKMVTHKKKNKWGRTIKDMNGKALRSGDWLTEKVYHMAQRSLADVDREMAERCRNILQERGIYIDERGRAIPIPEDKACWRDNLGAVDLLRAKVGGMADFPNDYSWFVSRYGQESEARNLLLAMDLLEMKMSTGEREEFLLERKLKAKDQGEMKFWTDMATDYGYYRRMRTQTEQLLSWYEQENARKNKR